MSISMKGLVLELFSMKKYFLLFTIIVALCFTGCIKKSNITSNEVKTDNYVDSQALLNNLDDYIIYEGALIDNKDLNLSFRFRRDYPVPKNPPIVEVKVYLWMNDDVIGIYHKPLYNTYEDYLSPVKLKFDAEGKEFNRYQVSFEGSTEEI